jgi:hypothetical protein
MSIRLNIRVTGKMARELAYGDEATAREIYLVESNDADLYRQMVVTTIENYGRRMKRGVYSKALALQGIQNNLVPEAIRRYKRSQGDIGPVSAAIKKRIAELWLPTIHEGAEYYAREGKF